MTDGDEECRDEESRPQSDFVARYRVQGDIVRRVVSCVRALGFANLILTAGVLVRLSDVDNACFIDRLHRLLLSPVPFVQSYQTSKTGIFVST